MQNRDDSPKELPGQSGSGEQVFPEPIQPDAGKEDQDRSTQVFEKILPATDVPPSTTSLPATKLGGQPAETDALYEDEPVERLANGDSRAPDPVPAEGSLATSGLHAWLDTIRPAEDQASAPSASEERQETESDGPLSGLRGILPAEVGVFQVGALPHYSTRLQISEAQARHATLLTEMLLAEGKVRSSSRRTITGELPLLRIAIALLLLAVVLWALLSGGLDVPLPPIPAEVGAANALVEGLSPGALALVAVDYEPGLAGEMEAASASVVDHLLQRGVHLALVSTSSSGPATAERLMTSSLHSDAPSSAALLYTNLGFLPGGAAGLYRLAQAPQLAMPYALDSRQKDLPAWAGGPLGGVQALSDFSLAVVITDDADRARAWIEQVGPALEGTPLVMVVSAQIEPIVRPYYQAVPQQVDGLLSGLAGGAAYEDLNGRPGLAASTWNAFSVGSLAAAGLVIVGGIVNLLMNAFAARRRQRGRDERS